MLPGRAAGPTLYQAAALNGGFPQSCTGLLRSPYCFSLPELIAQCLLHALTLLVTNRRELKVTGLYRLQADEVLNYSVLLV